MCFVPSKISGKTKKSSKRRQISRLPRFPTDHIWSSSAQTNPGMPWKSLHPKKIHQIWPWIYHPPEKFTYPKNDAINWNEFIHVSKKTMDFWRWYPLKKKHIAQVYHWSNLSKGFLLWQSVDVSSNQTFSGCFQGVGTWRWIHSTGHLGFWRRSSGIIKDARIFRSKARIFRWI